MLGWKDATDIARWAWDNRAGVKPLLAKFRQWLRRSKVLIIGPGGTGKTTLARVLSGQFDWLQDSPWVYDEDVSITKYRLKSDFAAELVVPPGQSHRRRSTWSGVGADVAKGEYRGVVLVSAFGYHTLPDESYKRHKLYDSAHTKDAFWRAYTEANRADEVACLRELVPFLGACPSKVWLASVVAKQDLWRAQETAVETWYREGDYGKLVAEVAAQKGATFRHEFHPCSLVIGNLVTAKGETFAKCTEGYDHRAQVESVRRLIEIVDGLHAWGSAK